MKSSDASPLSDARIARQLMPVTLFLAALICLAATWFYRNGSILYYGDAASHLNISRGLIDSLTPGYDQLGTVWLPMLHVICLPFVRNDGLWSNGLAGTLPVAFCFVVAGCGFFLSALETYQNQSAALVVVACFAFNPNLLYLGSIPMTEVVFLAGLSILLLSLLRFRRTQRSGWIALGVVAGWFLCLTRYDGWFLLPFAAVSFAFFSARRKWAVLLIFAGAAALAPAYWLVHNWWETGNALDFYNGPYSAIAIQGKPDYPGYHDWLKAAHYYGKAGQYCAGSTLVLLGILGTVAAAARRVLFPLFFLSLTPAFYVWSMHSSGGTPIHLPSLYPFSYYNSRYGIAIVVLCAFAAGALVLVIPKQRQMLALLIPLCAVFPWLLHPSRESWICLKESQVNSESRRAWTRAAATFLARHHTPGVIILTSAGDETGIYARNRLPLSKTLNIGNGPNWLAAITRPDLYHPAVWAVAQRGDLLFRALSRTPQSGYKAVQVFSTKDDPELVIFRRTPP